MQNSQPSSEGSKDATALSTRRSMTPPSFIHAPAFFRPAPRLRRLPHRPARRQVRAKASSSDSNIDAYNKWIADTQKARNAKATSSSLAASMISKPRIDTPRAPPFPHPSLFHAGAEEYAADMTVAPSRDFRAIAEETAAAGLYAPCMVGAVEGQFLKMLARASRAKRVLDIGTFTGYSALAFAEGVVDGGAVVTIEADAATATVARKVFARARYGRRIKLIEADARAEVADMVARGEKFDIVFLDADKTNYRSYYEAGLKMLNEGGLLMADNALCALVFAEDDPVRDSLHEFAQFVRADERVEQVMLTVREGILLVQKA